MAAVRRYGEDEIDEIFARAADESQRPPGSPGREGLTLAELQSIGEEVGLSPERVAEAAAAVEAEAPPPSRGTELAAVGRGPVGLSVGREASLGGPSTVSTSVDLPRAPTDREWEVLVADLRETFGAPGHVVSRGEAREWRLGEMHVFVEPSAGGTRLRMTDRRPPQTAVGLMGWVGLLLGTVLLVTRGLDAATFGATFEVLIPLILAGLGGASLAGVLWRARGWAQLREGQMARIAARACELTAAKAEADEKAEAEAEAEAADALDAGPQGPGAD